MVHHLELDEPYWSHVRDGDKTFEVRWEQGRGRRFNEGDILRFRPPGAPLDAPGFSVRVTYVLRDLEWYGVPAGLAILGIAEV